MRFVTYNIKLGLQRGLHEIIEIVRDLNPDVLALQEVGCNWRMGPPGDTAARISHRTGLSFRSFVPTLEASAGCRYGHALLAKWPLQTRTRRRLSRHTDEPRIVLTSDVIAPEGRVRMISTHLSHLRDERAVQGPELRHLVVQAREATRGGIPVVLAGDLNEVRSMPSPWFRDILEDFDEAGRLDDRPTFENPVPEERIDYLLVAGRRWKNARVIDEPHASDHRPLVAEF